MAGGRRVGGLFLLLGYLCVVAGAVAWTVTYWADGLPEIEVYQVSLPLGLGLAGYACWWWAIRPMNDEPSRVRSVPTRIMGAAALVVAAGIAAMTYVTYDEYRAVNALRPAGARAVQVIPHYHLFIGGGVVYTAGLVLAATGFAVLGGRSSSSAEHPPPESADSAAPRVEPVS